MPDLPPEVAELKRRMTEFSVIEYPDGCDDLVIDGVLVETVDTCAVGCISAFVKWRGELDEQRHDVLRNLMADFETIQPHLPEEARGSFEELQSMCREVLDLLDG